MDQIDQHQDDLERDECLRLLNDHLDRMERAGTRDRRVCDRSRQGVAPDPTSAAAVGEQSSGPTVRVKLVNTAGPGKSNSRGQVVRWSARMSHVHHRFVVGTVPCSRHVDPSSRRQR